MCLLLDHILVFPWDLETDALTTRKFRKSLQIAPPSTAQRGASCNPAARSTAGAHDPSFRAPEEGTAVLQRRLGKGHTAQGGADGTLGGLLGWRRHVFLGDSPSSLLLTIFPEAGAHLTLVCPWSPFNSATSWRPGALSAQPCSVPPSWGRWVSHSWGRGVALLSFEGWAAERCCGRGRGGRAAGRRRCVRAAPPQEERSPGRTARLRGRRAVDAERRGFNLLPFALER